jgi:hypothetical protein
MQARKVRIWKVIPILSIGAAAVYTSLGLVSIYVFPGRYTSCDRYTKSLNGGEKVYAGRKFRITLCGNGGDENFMRDKVRMQILSESGEVLAQRKFYVDWNGAGPFELSYGDDHLTYFDVAQDSNFEHKVSMPPTRLDWIRARLPLVD